MILPDRTATVNDVELREEDIARIFNTILFEFGETSALDCTIRSTFPDGSFSAASPDAFFENTTIPRELDSLSILVQMHTPDQRTVWLYASGDSVLINVEGGGESWNKGFFERIVESVKSSQRAPVVITKPTWHWVVLGLSVLVALLSSASGIDTFSKTGNPVVAIIGFGGVLTIGYLAYLSHKWNKEFDAMRIGPRPCSISIARRPGPAHPPLRPTFPHPTLDVGLSIVGAIAASIAAMVAIYVRLL